MAEVNNRRDVQTGETLTLGGEILQFNVSGGEVVIKHKLDETQGFVPAGILDTDSVYRERFAPGVLEFTTVTGHLSICAVPGN